MFLDPAEIGSKKLISLKNYEVLFKIFSFIKL